MSNFTDAIIADKYVLERELGRGGMATVWLARDVAHERRVAVKILHPELAGAIGIDRFVREVHLTSGLQHPSIVPILDSGTLLADDRTSLPWYAMAYLDGESLRARLDRESQLPIADAFRIARAVGGALAEAHRRGIVHRDVKPENVFLAGDHVYVVDFGIAKALLDTGGARLTSTGIVIGTPTYMSPEQGTGERVDERSDQYSLATILYEMLAGEPPFSGPNAQAVIARRIAEPARPLRAVRSTVPLHVERALLKALERSPADRFEHVDGFLAALDGGPQVAALSTRGRTLLGIVALGLVAAGVGASWMLSSLSRARATHSVDSVSVALYQRGVRAYDRRTPASIVDAVSALTGSIARDSSNELAWTALANTYVRADERGFAVPGVPRDSLLPRAVVAIERALSLNPKSADAWLAQAIATIRIDPTDWGPPARALRQSLSLDSTNAVTWHVFARSLAETGDLDAGIEAWHRSVRLNPRYGQGLAFVALGYYWREQFDSAAIWADSALAVDPNNLLARTSVGQIAIERGDFERAAAAFAAGRKLTTDVEFVNTFAGGALAAARAGRHSEAMTALRRVDSLTAAYAVIPLHTAVYVAQVYAALGDRDRAVAWLSRYDTPRDLHFQLHIRCDPPFTALAKDQRYRSFLLPIASPSGQPCGQTPRRPGS